MGSKDNRGGGGGSCGRCFCRCCCASFCCILLAVVLFVVIIAVNFERPSVQVVGAQLVDTQTQGGNDPAALLRMNISMEVENKNHWPIFGSVSDLDANVWSLDKDAGDNPASKLVFGKAKLPDPVKFDTDSTTDFTVAATMTVRPDAESAALVKRLTRDCGATSDQQTKLEVQLVAIKAKIANIVPVNLDGLDIPITMTVKCTGVSEALEEVAKHAGTRAAGALRDAASSVLTAKGDSR